MNKHIILTYEGEGSVAGIIQVEYNGTLEELHSAIDNMEYSDEEYHSVEDRMSDLGIKFEYIKHIVDCPYDGLRIEV